MEEGKTPYDIPQERGRGLAIALSILVHLLLIAFFWVSVSWQATTPLTVEAEVWDMQYKEAAPLPDPVQDDPQPEPEPVKEPEPVPEPTPVPPPPPPPTPAPKPEPVKQQVTPQKEDPEIALKQEKKRKEEEKKRVEEEKQRKLDEQKKQEEQKKQDQLKKLEEQKKQEELQKQKELQKQQELKKQQEEQKKQDQLKKQEEEKKKAEAQKKADADKKRQQADAAAADLRRQATLERMRSMAGGSGTAEKTQGPKGDPNYASKVALKVRSNTVFAVPPTVSGNPSVEFKVELLPDGSVRSISKTKSSGVPGFDEAVARAIEKSQPFPQDKDGKVPGSLNIVHRPKD